MAKHYSPQLVQAYRKEACRKNAEKVLWASNLVPAYRKSPSFEMLPAAVEIAFSNQFLCISSFTVFQPVVFG